MKTVMCNEIHTLDRIKSRLDIAGKELNELEDYPKKKHVEKIKLKLNEH